MAFAFSDLAKRIANEGLGDDYIVADDAYVASPWIITPWSGAKGTLKPHKACFNYWQSRTRTVVEQAFGIYVRRWGVLQSTLDVSLYHASLVVETTMKLHNICCDEGSYKDEPFNGTKGYRDADPNQNYNPFPEFQDQCALETLPGRRRDLEKSPARARITAHMEEQDMRRPVQKHKRLRVA